MLGRRLRTLILAALSLAFVFAFAGVAHAGYVRSQLTRTGWVQEGATDGHLVARIDMPRGYPQVIIFDLDSLEADDGAVLPFGLAVVSREPDPLGRLRRACGLER